MLLWANFLRIGTDLLKRGTVQGVEPALVSTSIEIAAATVIGAGENE
jgi:hypothetical protein